MFDSSFQISDIYFSILQMLRIFSDWIREVEESLPGLYNEVKEAAFFLQESCRNDELDNTFEFNLNTDILSQNLEKLDAKMRSSIRGLEARIERKKVEVESLRDGVCDLFRDSACERSIEC